MANGTPISPAICPNVLLSVDRQRRGSAVVVRFTGEIDMNSADAMREALAAGLIEASAPHPIVVDLTGVAFFGSAGIAELVAAHQCATEQQTPLRIVTIGRAVLRPLEATGMAAILDIHPDITAALAPAPSPTPHQQAQ